MKTNLVKSIRLKFLSISIGSVFVAISCIIFFQGILMKMGMSYERLSEVEREYAPGYMLAFLILTTVLFYVFSRKIIGRIENINESVNQIKDGNLECYIPVETQDEIGNLAYNINDMVKNLKDSIERAHEAEEMKNEMITNISHDLRTPLTSLKGYIELIKDNIYNNVGVCYDYIEVLDRKCNELKKQTEELLEYCNIQFNGLQPRKEIVGVKALVEQVVIDFIPQFEKADMTFNISYDREKLYFEVDIGLMIRLLQNIINNSIFYGQEGKRLAIYITTEAEEVKIKITNYGVSILPADMPYVFERLYRGEKSRSSNTGGKGLGLAIAKGIAQIHEGDIEVVSNEIETSFIISLPEYKEK